MSSSLPDEGDSCSICVSSLAPSPIVGFLSFNLTKIGVNCKFALIPSWKILMIVDFPTRNTLLMLLYQFPVESLSDFSEPFFYLDSFLGETINHLQISTR